MKVTIWKSSGLKTENKQGDMLDGYTRHGRRE